MEAFIVIIGFAFTLLCGVVAYKSIIATLDTIEDVVACIQDMRYILSDIHKTLKEK